MSEAKGYEKHKDSWVVKATITATLLALMASSGIQLAYVAGGGNKFSLMFSSQAGKAAAIIIWAALFMYFTLCGAATGEGDKSHSVQFAYNKDYRNLAIGFFLLIISLVQFGNPLLALLYLGDDGVNKFINENTDGSSGNIQYTLSTDTVFSIFGAVTSYCAGFGAALMGYATFQRCTRANKEKK